MIKIKITALGVLLSYPFGPTGPYRTMRQYIIEAEDGRIDKIEEWDEAPIPSGEYELPKETVDSMFNKQVILEEGEW